MMHDWEKIVTPFVAFKQGYVTFGPDGCGYTLRLGKVEEVMEYGASFRYLIKVLEGITMPADFYGMLHLKSTHVRRGFWLSSGVVDNGFIGYLTVGLWGPYINIKEGDGLLTMTLHKANADFPYEGQYQEKEIHK